MIFGILLFIFVVVCILLCLLILIQSDKGGGISGAIGGGFASASNLLGSQDTANILTRGTTILASIFLGLCLILSVFLSHPTGAQTKSALKERAEKQGSFSPSSVLQGGQQLPMGASGNAEAPGAPVPSGLPQGAAPSAPPAAAPSAAGQAAPAPQPFIPVPAPAKK
jgi:preprotein translocase subunit SecG